MHACMVGSKIVLLVGTAGSGKSVLAGVLKERIELFGATAITVNLDPAVRVLPYEPNVDCRRYVSYEELLEQGLGPNGAMIASVDKLVFSIDEILNEVEEYKADYVIIDTPGQMEVFAYRAGGQILARAFQGYGPTLTVFLIDALFFEDPLSIVSALSLSSSVALRFQLPQLNVASKADLLLPEVVEEILPRLGEEGFLESLIDAKEDVNAQTRLMAKRMLEAVREAGFIGEVLPISAFAPETVDALYGRMQQILGGGEEPSAYK